MGIICRVSYVVLTLLLSLFILHIPFSTSTNVTIEFQVEKVIEARIEKLRKVATDLEPIENCPTNRLIQITGKQYGNFGNELIEFTHGLWLSHRLNATLIVPSWIQGALSPFNLTLLRSYHCFTFTEEKVNNIHFIDITSEEAFYLFKVFNGNRKISLPPLNQDTIADLSHHFLKVYSGLWSYPPPEIFNISQWIIGIKLGDDLSYTAAHKRSMEGTCNRVMNQISTPNQFSSSEIPMNSSHWRNVIHAHPFCEMTISFIKDTQRLNGRGKRRIFVAFDGRGRIDQHLKERAVFTHKAIEGLPSEKKPKVHVKYIDMFVAMHSDLFISNPKSTFSWQIYVLRVCMGLESVPILQNNDFYMRTPELFLKEQHNMLWVSWLSVVKAFNVLKKRVGF